LSGSTASSQALLRPGEVLWIEPGFAFRVTIVHGWHDGTRLVVTGEVLDHVGDVIRTEIMAVPPGQPRAAQKPKPRWPLPPRRSAPHVPPPGNQRLFGEAAHNLARSR